CTLKLQATDAVAGVTKWHSDNRICNTGSAAGQALITSHAALLRGYFAGRRYAYPACGRRP
ncbi:hypothetical protein, partial [Klebsiella quasipneumoniae]